MISGGGLARDTALHYIYLQWYAVATGLLKKRGGESQDVEDTIQDAIIKLDNNIRNGHYRKESSLRNYFLGICKWRLYSKMRGQNKTDYTDNDQEFDGVEMRQPEVLMLEEEQKDIIGRALKMLDETCQELLLLFRLSYSMEEITTTLNLGNANNARQRNFTCLKKLRKILENNPTLSNYLKDL